MFTAHRFILFIAVLGIGFLPVHGQSVWKPGEISGFSHPESVCQSGNVFYVSNTGAGVDPVAKDGDGFISKVDPVTGITDLHYLPVEGVLNSPKGMALYKNVLYVADIDHIEGFDLSTRKRVVDLAVSGTHFLNDLVVANGKLYASATDNGKIFVMDPATKECHALNLSDTIVGANGLAFDRISATLYCVGVGTWTKPDGKIYSIDLSSGKVRVISDYAGMLDGVALKGQTLYFSDWKGTNTKGNLLALDLGTHTIRELHFSRGEITGPADFSISEDGKFFIIPAMVEGKVLVEGVE